jgi:hypothetical protein
MKLLQGKNALVTGASKELEDLSRCAMQNKVPTLPLPIYLV